MFSVFYSLFILPLHQGVSLWAVVFVQGAMLGHLLNLVIRCVSGGNVGKLQTLLVVAALCLFSSLPWFTGQLMPDVFTSVVLLGTFLLAFCADLLSRRELIYVAVLTAAAIATHLSHIVIAFGLILLCGALVPMFVTTQIEIRRWMALLFLPFILAVCSILAVNWINSRAITFARNSNVFVLAKLIEEGPALAYLARACPDIQYSLCAHMDEMKGMHQDDLKWWGGSPFYKVGGLDQLEPEASRIVWATLRTYPLKSSRASSPIQAPAHLPIWHRRRAELRGRCIWLRRTSVRSSATKWRNRSCDQNRRTTNCQSPSSGGCMPLALASSFVWWVFGR